jgi:hypothetical protein
VKFGNVVHFNKKSNMTHKRTDLFKPQIAIFPNDTHSSNHHIYIQCLPTVALLLPIYHPTVLSHFSSTLTSQIHISLGLQNSLVTASCWMTKHCKLLWSHTLKAIYVQTICFAYCIVLKRCIDGLFRPKHVAVFYKGSTVIGWTLEAFALSVPKHRGWTALN